MTYIAGFKRKNFICISADHMITFNRGTLNDGATLSGQSIRFNMDDSAFKIFHLKNSGIASFAGNAETGSRVINAILPESNSQLRIMQILKEQTPTKKQNATLIFGGPDDNNNMRLYSWSSSIPGQINEGDFFTAGSGKSILDNAIEPIFEEIKKIDTSNREKACNSSFILNELLYRNGKELSKAGVGGAFYSLFSDGNQIYSQGETAILPIELIPKPISVRVPIIKQSYKNGIYFIKSTITDRPKFIINKENVPQNMLPILSKNPIPMIELEKYWKLEDALDIEQVTNIEIHFIRDGFGSMRITCKPKEHLWWGESRKDVKFSENIKDLIQKLIKNMGQDNMS